MSQSQSAARDGRGKHRIVAELKRMEQEARLLEEELAQLDKMELASAVCQESLGMVEPKPDPLLSVTKAPLNPAWDRWFESPQEGQPCSRCCCFCLWMRLH